jgi:hypothetical protein
MTRTSLVCALAVLVVAIPATAQQLTFSATGSYELDGLAQASGPAFGFSNSFAQSGSGGGVISYSNNVTADNPDQGVHGIATGAVSANATIGSVGVAFSGSPSASNDMLAQPSFQQTSGRGQVETSGVSGQWQDLVTFDIPNVPAGTVIIQLGGVLVLHGSFTDSFSGGPVNDYRFGSSQFTVSLTGFGALGGRGGLPSIGPYGASYYAVYFADSTNGINVNDAPPAAVPVMFQLQNGIPTILGYQIRLTGGASAASGALFGTTATGSISNEFNVNFSQTLAWGGISSVTDASTGQPITGWTLTSASGFDYTQSAVPEPSTLTFISLGVLGLARLRRRRWAG